MTSSLRVRAAIVLLLGTLLIPVATSSLRGLTHLLSRRAPVAARFDVQVPTQGHDPVAVLLAPTAVTRPGDTVDPGHITRPNPSDGGYVTRPAPGSGPTTTATTATATATTLPATTTTPVTITITVPPPTTRPAAPKPQPVCGGITIAMKLSAPAPGYVRVDLPVTNSGKNDWRGTIQLRVGSKVFPVELGSIPPGRTRTRSIEVRVDTTVDRVTGQLMLGP